jgi:transcriptional regulator with XRE-family HTH domain
MPIVRDPLDPRRSLWHWLAFELRYLRELHGLSLTQVGQIINAARSTVCNIEAGRRRLDDDQAKILDERYGTHHILQLLLYFARLGHEPEWFQQYTQYEAEASILKIYQGQGIPMPLQTELYTRALLQESNNEDFEDELKSRLLRQNLLLERPSPPYIWVLLDEAALEYEVGGRQVIPKSAGAHMGLDGPFRIIETGNHSIAYAGASRGGRLIETPSEVHAMSIDYERISQKALPEHSSHALIKNLMERS